MYWLDSLAQHLARCDYDGENRKTVFRSTTLENLYGLTVFQNMLFLPSWKEKAIMQRNKFQPSNLTV